MKPELLFKFTANKENNTIHIVREIAAGIQSVWDAWTKREILDKWWAPKPYRCKTKTFDFREGGFWLYAMVSPENETHWSRMDYKEIKPLEQLICKDSFSDENGHIDQQMPHALWTIGFSENSNVTTIDITLKTDSISELEKLLDMGFEEGMTATLNYLNELLK